MTQETLGTTQSMQCIWCGRPSGTSEPVEHIVPEAIGCPVDFVLRNGEVCGPCNNGLAHLDQALVGDLEVYAAIAGVPRKGGRSPLISSYGNLRAGVRNGEMEFHFNMGPDSVVMPDGKVLPPYRGKPRDVSATFERIGNQAIINYDVQFGESPKVARALVKMGAEYLCWAKGRELASKVINGQVADFVRFGKGKRPVIIGNPDKDRYEHQFGHIGLEGEDGWYCSFRLAHFEVIVDLGPGQAVFDLMASRIYEKLGRHGWTTLPPEAFVR